MTSLIKSLSVMRGAGLMVNIVVGAGLLALPGLVVAMAGNHALWAWVLCALAAIPLLVVFVVMGRRFPHAGGMAHFSAMAFGPVGYIVTSFIFLGAVIFGIPAIALTGGYYITEILPGQPSVYAAALIIAGGLVHFISPEAAGRFSTIMASVIIFSLCSIVLIGFQGIQWEHAGDNLSSLKAFDIHLALSPFMMIFFAFTGWEVAAGLSEEFKDPVRDFPYAVAFSFIMVCALYFLLAFVVQNAALTASYEASLVSITEKVLGSVAGAMIAVLAALIVLANLMGAIWAISRMVFSLSREKYLALTLKTNKKGSPFSSVVLIVFVFLIVLSLDTIGFWDMSKMLSLAGQNFLVLYGITGLSLFRLSDKAWEKAVSALTLVLVLVLLFIQGLWLFYPIGLSLLGVVVWYMTRGRVGKISAVQGTLRKASETQREKLS